MLYELYDKLKTIILQLNNIAVVIVSYHILKVLHYSLVNVYRFAKHANKVYHFSLSNTTAKNE